MMDEERFYRSTRWFSKIDPIVNVMESGSYTCAGVQAPAGNCHGEA